MYLWIEKLLADKQFGPIELTIYKHENSGKFWAVIGQPQDYEVISTKSYHSIKTVMDELEKKAKDFLFYEPERV